MLAPFVIGEQTLVSHPTKQGTEYVTKGEGSTIGELYQAFHYLPIQFKGKNYDKHTNLLLTGEDLTEGDWERLDSCSF